MTKKIILLLTFILMASAVDLSAQNYELCSPDGQLTVSVTTGSKLRWSVNHQQTQVLLPSCVAMRRADAASGKPLPSYGDEVKVVRAERASVNSKFATPFYKRAEVTDCYNALTLQFHGGYSVEFRAYNDGAAYRFAATSHKPYRVTHEVAEFNFADNHRMFVPYVNDNRGGERYCYSFESYYDECFIDRMYPDSLAITPLMVDIGCGLKAVVMEAGVENYPGMFLSLNTNTQRGLKAVFAPYPLKHEIGGHARLNLIPTERASYIAHVDEGSRTFPWRVVLVTLSDLQLADNDMAQRLASPCRITDTSWIKPGKVAWDWWNTCNLTGVDFVAGMNTPTYKAFIDFAAANGLEYIIIDEGWSGKESLTTELNPDIDLPYLVNYGKEKGVGIILWASWRNLALNGMNGTPEQMEQTMQHYAAMGIKGFKVDFFDRDDQPLIASVEQMAACAARHHLLLDLHGLRPNGLHRAYPNILNYEGVKGLENAKWEPMADGLPLHDFPRYDVTIPYLRQLLGPMDYTPGAMTNATRTDFRPVNDHPMSQGTRVHQMAMYTLFEAPLQMLADSPSSYMREQTCTDFISAVPTTFDETIALQGAIGEYLVMARRKANVWYVAGMTNWKERTVTLPLHFVGKARAKAVIFTDGVNAHRNASDYRCRECTVSSNDSLTLTMAPGGGFAIRIEME